MKLNENDRIGGKRTVKKSNWPLILLALIAFFSTLSAGYLYLINNPNTVFDGPLAELNKYVVKEVVLSSVEPLEIKVATKGSAPGALAELLEDEKQLVQEHKPFDYIKPAETAPKTLAPKEKQTVFNDSNYQPKGSVNSIAPPPSKYYTQGPEKDSAFIKETVSRSFGRNIAHSRTIPWEWKSEKTHHQGRFNFVERNGRIETSKVCSNYKYGSFIYRDCRKAAKKYFNEACSGGYKAACTASNMAP